MVVAVFSDRSTMWPKTRIGGCKCISVFALASGHFGIAKPLQQRLLRATPQELAWLASLPCVLHQTPFLPVKNNRATVPLLPGLPSKENLGHGFAALWGWGERKGFPGRVSVTWPPRKVLLQLLSHFCPGVWERRSWVCLVKDYVQAMGSREAQRKGLWSDNGFLTAGGEARIEPESLPGLWQRHLFMFSSVLSIPRIYLMVVWENPGQLVSLWTLAKQLSLYLMCVCMYVYMRV